MSEVQAKIKEVKVPIDEHTARYAYQVEYANPYDGCWLFHSIHEDKNIAQYVADGIEAGTIKVLIYRR